MAPPFASAPETVRAECLAYPSADFYRLAAVRDGKAAKELVAMLPSTLEAQLAEHLVVVKELHVPQR